MDQAELSLRDALAGRLLQAKDDVMYTWIGKSGTPEHILTAGDLVRRAGGMARKLREARPAGGVVGLSLAAGPEFLIAFLATLFAGNTALPLPAPGTGPDQRHLDTALAAVEPDIIVAEAKDLSRLAAKVPGATLVTPESDEAEPPHCDPATIAVLQLTSGTTHDAKVVRLPDRAILANARFFRETWNFDVGTSRRPSDMSTLNWLPHYHNMGLFGYLINPLLAGAAVVQISTLDVIQRPYRWLRAVQDTTCVTTGGPAFSLQLCMEKITPEEVETLDLSHLVVFSCGSEPIEPHLLDRFRAAFSPAGLRPEVLFPCYGMSEMTVFLAGRPTRRRDNSCRLCCDGQHHIGVLDPESGEIRTEAGTGEIVATGPSMCDGYLAPAELPLLRTSSGQAWLRTGDLGRIADGYLSVIGRVKELLIVNGRNVSASEIEWLAADVEPALNPLGGAAFAVGDLAAGHAVLVIETLPGRTVSDPAEASQRIKARLRSAFGLADVTIRIVGPVTLERTPNGKIRREAVRDRFASGAFDGESA